MEDKVKGLNALSQELHQRQIDMGFDDPNITQRLMLITSEVVEAFEAFRKDNYADIYKFNKMSEEDTLELESDKNLSFKVNFEDTIKDTMEDECADIMIRLLAFSGENNIDIEFHVKEKDKYNQLRGHKYGGKKF